MSAKFGDSGGCISAVVAEHSHLTKPNIMTTLLYTFYIMSMDTFMFYFHLLL